MGIEECLEFATSWPAKHTNLTLIRKHGFKANVAASRGGGEVYGGDVRGSCGGGTAECGAFSYSDPDLVLTLLYHCYWTNRHVSPFVCHRTWCYSSRRQKL